MKAQESLIRLVLTLASTVIFGTGVTQAAPANLSLIVSASPGTGTLCLVVSSNSAAKTVAEFLQMAKTSAKGVNYASPGNGTPQHLAMELLKFEDGLYLFHVPFKGSSGAVNDVAAWHVSAMIAPVLN